MDIIILFFLARHIGNLAERKGLKRAQWIIYTVISWIVAELTGCLAAIVFLGMNDIISVALFALFCAFGGYLFVHAMIKKHPDQFQKNDNDLL